MSPQKPRVEWLVSSPTESNLHRVHPLGLMLVSSFQSLFPCLEFSSHFLSSLSWQDLQKELGGAPRSCLWRSLQCVYLSKRIGQTLLTAVLPIKSWASLSSSVMIWSSRMIWKKTIRANYRTQSDFQMHPPFFFFSYGELRNLVLWMNPIYIFVGIGKVGF